MGNNKIVKSINDLSPKSNDATLDSQNVVFYANYLFFENENKSLFKEGAYTVLYIKEQEQPIRMECIASSKSIRTDKLIDNNRIDGSLLKLKNNISWTIVSGFNVQSFEDRNKIVLFTKDFPLDPTLASNGKQNIYISRETIPNEINSKIQNAQIPEMLSAVIAEMKDTNNMTQTSLEDISLINTLTNSAIIFENYVDLSGGIEEIKVEYDNSFALAFNEGIIVKDAFGKDVKETSLEIANNLSSVGLMKMIPISTKRKLEVMCETIDINKNLQRQIFYPFIPAYTPGGIFGPGNIPENFGGLALRSRIMANFSQDWKKELWKCFLSALELTKAYANGFAEYQIKGTDGRSGINPDATIGGKKIGLLSGTNSTDAKITIDGRFADWESDHNLYINSREYNNIKASILYLTPFFQSKFAFGGGLNHYHSIYQIFYFDINSTGKIKKGLADNEQNDILLTLKSEFIDFYKVNPTIKDELISPLNNKKTINQNGYLSLAEIPDEWEELNIPTNPADINPTNDDLSKHYVYVPTQSLMDLYDFSLNAKPINSNSIRQEERTMWVEKTIEVIDEGARGLSDAEWKDKINKDFNGPQNNGTSGERNLGPLAWYNKYVSRNLSSNETIIKIGNEPRIELYNVGPFAYNGDNDGNGHTGGPQLLKLEQSYYQSTETPPGFENNPFYGAVEIKTIRITYRYKLRYYVNVKQSSLLSSDYIYPIFNKGTYTEFVKTKWNQQSFWWKFSFDKDKFKSIGKFMISGMWGDQFSLKISGYDKNGNKTQMYINNVDFFSRYTETNTTTEICL